MSSFPANLFLLVLRLCWIGLFAPIAVTFPIVGAIYLSSFKGVSLVVNELILILVYFLIIIPSLVMGFLPIAVIDKKPLVVRIFYKITIPLLLGILVLLVLSSVNWYSTSTQDARHALSDTQLLIALIIGSIFVGGVAIFIASIVRSSKSNAIPQMIGATDKSEPIACMSCGAAIAPGAERCEICGWSYKQ
jgi:hypothetical protein